MNGKIRYLGLAAIMATLMACSDDDNQTPQQVVEPTEPPAPANAFLRVTHASPDAPAVNVLANGDILGGLEGVGYQVSSGWLTVPEATYDVQVDALLPDSSTAAVITASHIP